MAAAIQALSVSRSLWERLPVQPAPGRVLAVFDRSCLLCPDDGEPLSLVLPALCDGPLNVVIEAGPNAFVGIEPGWPVSLSRARLRAGPRLVVDLAEARAWEPCPPWPVLRAAFWPCHREEPRLWATKQSPAGDWEPILFRPRGLLGPPTALARNDGGDEGDAHAQSPPGPGTMEERLNRVHAAAVRRAPGGSLVELFRSVAWGRGREAQTLEVARRAVEALASGWAGDAEALARGARRLAGLGGGLTPAGDDFLAGAMLRGWLAHPEPEAFCRPVVEAAAPRTTVLSVAFLRAAARGECSAAWHELLAALAGGGAGSLDEAVRGVLAHGHTSGADMLAGFLWEPVKTTTARRGSQSAGCVEGAGL